MTTGLGREKWKKMSGSRGNRSTSAVLQRELRCSCAILSRTEAVGNQLRMGFEQPLPGSHWSLVDRGKICSWAPAWPGSLDENQNLSPRKEWT